MSDFDAQMASEMQCPIVQMEQVKTESGCPAPLTLQIRVAKRLESDSPEAVKVL